ncbi:MAG: hypothetical protein JXB46_03345 [Candidatus Eisenbacteria bacterium]|nr:hypothetical protein [Candidatus Eisenbacteria bacterium]
MTAGTQPHPDVRGIECFWRAANYLSLSLLYLRKFVLPARDLTRSDVRSRVFGHWGVCPSVNAVYGQVCDLARRHGLRTQLVVGPGHAGPSLLACAFLDGSLEVSYPEFTRDRDGMTRLLESYGSDTGFPTEISASYPGVDFVGGELGSALGFAQGLAIGSPQRLVVCLIGDGELETALGQSSFQGFDFLSPAADGMVLPVINANGHRMGSRSLWSMRSRSRQVDFLRAHGLCPEYVGTDHGEFARALDIAVDHTRGCDGSWPAVVLETPKGWSGPTELNGLTFAGTRRAHKPLLRDPARNSDELESLRHWLMSYEPETLFDPAGRPSADVLRCVPAFGAGITSVQETARSTPVMMDAGPAARTAFDAIRVAVREMAQNHDQVYLVSPDELESNQFSAQSAATPLRHGRCDDPEFSPTSRILEILNENLCFAWSLGLAASGRFPFLITYEAFAPVFASQADQALKFLTASLENGWSRPSFSVNLILTSLGWYNTPTHHNPGFVDSLLLRETTGVQVYMPVRPQHAVQHLRQAVASAGKLNVFVVSKHGLRALRSLEPPDVPPDEGPDAGWTEIVPPGQLGPVAVTLVTIGDLMAEQALQAIPTLAEHVGCRASVVAVEDLSLLVNSHHSGRESFRRRLAGGAGAVWLYNGRPGVVKARLVELGLPVDSVVLGYQDHDQSPSGVARLRANGIDAATIVNAVREMGRKAS